MEWGRRTKWPEMAPLGSNAIDATPSITSSASPFAADSIFASVLQRKWGSGLSESRFPLAVPRSLMGPAYGLVKVLFLLFWACFLEIEKPPLQGAHLLSYDSNSSNFCFLF